MRTCAIDDARYVAVPYNHTEVGTSTASPSRYRYLSTANAKRATQLGTAAGERLRAERVPVNREACARGLECAARRECASKTVI